MSAIATVSKATLTTLAPFVAVYFWPKDPQVFTYTAKNSTTPLISFPRPSAIVAQAKEGHRI